MGGENYQFDKRILSFISLVFRSILSLLSVKIQILYICFIYIYYKLSIFVEIRHSEMKLKKIVPKITLAIFVIWIIAQIVVVYLYWGEPQYSDAERYRIYAAQCYANGTWYPDSSQTYIKKLIFIRRGIKINSLPSSLYMSQDPNRSYIN